MQHVFKIIVSVIVGILGMIAGMTVILLVGTIHIIVMVSAIADIICGVVVIIGIMG